MRAVQFEVSSHPTCADTTITITSKYLAIGYYLWSPAYRNFPPESQTTRFCGFQMRFQTVQITAVSTVPNLLVECALTHKEIELNPMDLTNEYTPYHIPGIYLQI
jgi:hypothetical protein